VTCPEKGRGLPNENVLKKRSGNKKTTKTPLSQKKKKRKEEKRERRSSGKRENIGRPSRTLSGAEDGRGKKERPEPEVEASSPGRATGPRKVITGDSPGKKNPGRITLKLKREGVVR